jgi:hypothetical protein
MMAHQLKLLVVMLALEWELCSQDPFIFCYRMGCAVFKSPVGDAPHSVDSYS